MDIFNVISSALLAIGSFLVLSGGLGVLRFPDVYSRMHAAGITDTLGAVMILLALMLLAGWSLVLAKLIMIMLFLLITGPTASHALGKAAWKSGLQPLTDKSNGR
ncbi:monovalent cation/H(+) antiporter subunit G [Spongiibacter sp.]|uniref:monovalent cation/H(+) antiporter subunit G n=1 Tax=Spongiibacter sp. TaxID=2024860 RepID=UPI0035669F29